MPTQDGLLDSRDLCDSSVLERTLANESVSSLKIQANLQSDNFVAGTSGWEINRDTGSVEFQDATIRGTLNASDITAGTMNAARIGAGTITAVEIILTNSASAILRSSNYSANSAGWRIRGDGDAEFNDVEVRGDLVSGNWNGTDPPSLASWDTGASLGWAFDSSQGAAQLEGNVYVGGTVHIGESDTDDRIELQASAAGTIKFYHEGNVSAFANADQNGSITSLFIDKGQMSLRASRDNDQKFAVLTVQSADATSDAGVIISEEGDTTDTHMSELLRIVPSETDTEGLYITMPGATTVPALRIDGGDMILDGELNLQDAGVTEWQIRANTSDNFQILDDDGTSRFQIDQTGGTAFRDDAGTLIFDLDNGSADFDAGNSQTFVLVLPVKTTTGQATAIEGAIVVNTEASVRTLRLYANGAWRNVFSW